MLTDNEINIIIDLLKHSYKSFEDISTQLNIDPKIISKINSGSMYKRDSEIYPIRLYKPKGEHLKFTYEQVSEIIDLLVTTDLSLRSIAKMYSDCGAKYDDIVGIKNGTQKLYRRRELTYPLRKNN